MAGTLKSIRVLRIIARMNVGGPAVQVSGLMRHLDPSLYEQRLLTGFCAADEADYLETQASDLRATRIEGLGRSISPLADIRAFLSIRSAIREFRPDLIHTHTAKAGVLGRLAACTVFPHPKLVHTFHGHLLHGYFGRFGTKLVITAERILGYVTDALVAVGPEVRDDLIAARIGNSSKFHVVEPGLELSEFPTQHQARERLGITVGTPVVSYVGRITNIKRPDRMLETISKARVSIPELLVIVAGDGDRKDETQDLARNADLPIRFLGWRSDVETILAAGDVTLLTSDNEGTPLSLIQAAMLGVPCVTTDVGSVRHIVEDGETGWVVPADSNALSIALVKAFTDRVERERRGRAASAWALARFSVQRLARDYGDLYSSLVKTHV